MTMDANSAVSLLKAAGDDIDALSQAIIKASFLDDIPGEDRQKLRGEGPRWAAVMLACWASMSAWCAGGMSAPQI